MGGASERINQLSPLQRAAFALKEMHSKLDAMEKSKTEPIAIVGVGCRFPGAANDPESFWKLLCDGVDATREAPSSRWSIDTYYDPNPDTPGKMYVQRGGFLDDVDRFDAEFFDISPREATSLDPQQRLLLEVSWEALENAGQAPDKLNGSQTGVFIGVCHSDYLPLESLCELANIDVYTATGSTMTGMGAGRLSYILGLHGPTLTLDTTCSSSLVSVHLACQSLRSGECSLALAGGVNLMLSPTGAIVMSKVKALATDGRCKTFDAAADGYGRGEGCGMIVLKRLSNAIADSDNILAVIRGSAINHDGRSSGLTVPNGLSQQKVIEAALSDARVEPTQISYVEVHGTGTALGDPIEIQSLKAVLGQERSAEQPLMIGSVKTNIGHLEAAAGIAGLIKVVSAMQHEEIPPHLHLKTLNPHISLEGRYLKIPTDRTPWLVAEGQRRLAGVSAFGMSGTNAHIVLEEAPSQSQNLKINSQNGEVIERPLHLLGLSAKSKEALKELASRLASYLATHPEKTLEDVCFTANAGRSHFTHRLAVVASSLTQAQEQLTAFAISQKYDDEPHASRANVAFLFTGQGSQYVDMGRQLYETQPTFRKTLDYCDKLLQEHYHQSILSKIYPEPGERGDKKEKKEKTSLSALDETAFTQPALFALEYALAQLWRSWGIEPAVVMGHSVGEYVAACIAGVFSLEDGLKLITERGRLMQALPPDGEMVAVLATEEQVSEAVEPYSGQISIAAVNAPNNVVISGVSEVVRTVVSKLESSGVETRKLKVSHAFHSASMEPMLADFERIAAEVAYSSPRIGLISNLTGQLAGGDVVACPDYWCEHVRQPVRFAESMKTLHEQGYELFVEIGPHPILIGMGKQCLPQDVGVWLPSLKKDQEDWQVLLQSLGILYVQGQVVNWVGFDQDYRRRRLQLPTYPFERQRYWAEPVKRQPQASVTFSPIAHPMLGKRLHSPLQPIQFESQFSIKSLPLVCDHQVYGMALVNFAIYLELIFAGVAEAFGVKPSVLEDLFIFQGIILSEEEVRTIQLIITPEDSEKASFQIFSLSNNETTQQKAWTLHAAGKVGISNPEMTAFTSDYGSLKDIQAQYETEISTSEFYQIIAERGIRLGPSCRGLERIWRRQGRALGQIGLSHTADNDLYQLPLSGVDALFQIAFPCFLATEADNYLISGIGSFRFYRNSEKSLWCEAILKLSERQESCKEISGHLHLFDETGQLVAEAVNVQLKCASREALQHTAELDKLNATRQTKRGSLSREKLLAAEIGERRFMLENYLIEELAYSLKLSVTKLNSQQSLILLIDSLIAIELSNQIKTDLQVKVPIEKFLGDNSVAQLADFLSDQIDLVNLIELASHSDLNEEGEREKLSF